MAAKTFTLDYLRILAIVVVSALVGGFIGWSVHSHSNKQPKSKTGATFEFNYQADLTGPVMVTDNNNNGKPDYGDAITFNAKSNAQFYFVRTICNQNGSLVFEETKGFYPDWQLDRTYTLSSPVWKSGAADCTATMYYQVDNDKTTDQVNLKTLNFHVSS